MSILPFVMNDQTPQTHRVEDNFGHSIELIKYGCLTVEEAEIYHRLTLEAVRSDTAPFFCYKADLVYQLLCSRYNIPLNTAKNEVFRYPDGTPVGEPMIEAIYDFFEWERLRWDTEAKNREQSARNSSEGKLIGEQSISG